VNVIVSGGGEIMYTYSTSIDFRRSLKKIVNTLIKEIIVIANTGVGRLNPKDIDNDFTG